MSKIFITGSTRGLGKSLAASLAMNDHEVCTHGRTSGDFPANLLCEEEIVSLSKHICAGSYDIFVNNAAILDNIAFDLMGHQEIHNILDTNIYAPIILLQTIYRTFKKRGYGLIVNINSIFCKNPSGKDSVFGASKMALRGLLQSLSIDSMKSNVNILDVYLGSTDTEMTYHIYTPKIDLHEAGNIIAQLIRLANQTKSCSLSEIVLRNNAV
jgi:short-subunit dehydrogenase